MLALLVLYAERRGCVCRSLAGEGHEYALGLAALDGDDDGLARGEEPLAGAADGHVVGTVVGDDHGEFALGRQEAGSTAGQLVKGERVGVAGHRALGIGTLQRVLEEGRVAEDGVEEEF